MVEKSLRENGVRKEWSGKEWRRKVKAMHQTLWHTTLQTLFYFKILTDLVQFTDIFLMSKIHSDCNQRHDIKYFIRLLPDSSKWSSCSVAQERKPPWLDIRGSLCELWCIPLSGSCPTSSRHLHEEKGGLGCILYTTQWKKGLFLNFNSQCRCADMQTLHNLSLSCNWKQG